MPDHCHALRRVMLDPISHDAAAALVIHRSFLSCLQRITELAKRHEGGIPNDVARLKGARFVSASEADEGRRLAEATIKTLTGGDTLTARFMRAEWFDFKPEFTLWLATNHRPVIRGTDKAIWDRLRLVPFTVRIPDAEQDRQLRDKLLAEAPGILAWAVRGCLEWQRGGLGYPVAVREATEGYRIEQDVLGSFIADCCVTGAGYHATAKDLYSAYSGWCDESNERPLAKNDFGRRLRERGFTDARGAQGARRWCGIGLRDSPQQGALLAGPAPAPVTNSPQVTNGDAISGMNNLVAPHEASSGKSRHRSSPRHLAPPDPDETGTEDPPAALSLAGLDVPTESECRGCGVQTDNGRPYCRSCM